MKAVLALLLVPSVLFAATTPAPKPKPAFQYESGDIQVSIPTANEPRVKQFGAESIQAAVKYLEDGAVCWVREKSCVNCHTTGPYLSERPALIPQLGKPSEEIVADFIEFVPKDIKEVKETATKSGYKHMPGTFSAVWRSLGLAEWDRHITGKMSEHTERSIRDMFERQAASGAFVSSFSSLRPASHPGAAVMVRAACSESSKSVVMCGISTSPWLTKAPLAA